MKQRCCRARSTLALAGFSDEETNNTDHGTIFVSLCFEGILESFKFTEYGAKFDRHSV